MRFSKAVQRGFRLCGLSLTRLPANRFDAMPDLLQRFVQEGFEPTLVIDVGASCRAVLEALEARRGNPLVADESWA